MRQTELHDQIPDNRAFSRIEGLNLQFKDGGMIWWRHDRKMNQEGTLVMTDIYLENTFFRWRTSGADFDTDIIFAVRYTATETKKREMLLREQRVRTLDLRAYDLIIEGPYPVPTVSDLRN